MTLEKETIAYISSHPHVMHCITQDIINNSALAENIAKENELDISTTKDKIIRSISRYSETLKTEDTRQMKICHILMNHETQIKNRISELVISKDVNLKRIYEIKAEHMDESSTFYLAEYPSFYKIITNQRSMKNIRDKFGPDKIKEIDGCIIISFTTPYDNEDIPGIFSHITSLLLENDIKMIDFFGCWKDTILVLDEKDLEKAIEILHF